MPGSHICPHKRCPHQRVFMVHHHHQFLLPWSIYCIISVLPLDVLCHNCFIIRVLLKRLMTMLCYVFVGGQGLSVQRTLPYTCFPHISTKLPQHGPTKYNTFFLYNVYNNLCPWNYIHHNHNDKKVFHCPLLYYLLCKLWENCLTLLLLLVATIG